MNPAAVALIVLPWLLGAEPAAAPAPEPPPSEASAPAHDTPPPPSELHRAPDYPGAIAFFGLDALTVVYPAGPGEPVEVNRRSAEARARWLASVHRVKIDVAADDQLTEEQKKGNLLLLGWTNRVFGSPELPRPFAHDATGTRFAGLQEPDPDVDLFLFHQNPLNWSSLILFWSRIDPELDRFLIVPRIGSDWALYRNFQPIRQGMLVPGHAWPPSRDTLAEIDHTSSELGLPATRGTIDAAHYHVSFDRTKFASADAQAIADARESALTRAVAAIGPLPAGFRIYLYVYDDEGIKADATGVSDSTHSVPSAQELYMVRRFARSTSPHEEVHLVARATYGPCFATAIYEGLALAVETTWKGESLETHAALLRRAGKLPGPAVLLDEERFRALPSAIGLPAAGAFMTWVRQTYGPEGVKKIYGWQDGRVSSFAAALGTNEVDLAGSFAAWADAKVLASKHDLDFRDAEAEARAKQLVADWPGMTAALRKALAAKPGDLQTMFNLASAQMRADDLTGAEQTLKLVLAAPHAPETARFVVWSHYQLGRVYDLGGRRAEALAEYDAALALPDDHGVHDLARERKASPATKAQLE